MSIFTRIARFLKGFLLLFIGKAEMSNPRAVLEAEIDKFNKAQADFNNGLARQAGMIKRLEGQILKNQKDIEGLNGRIESLISVDDSTKAGELAVMLQRTEDELAENQKQREAAEAMYKDLTNQRDAFVKEARKSIENIKAKMTAAEMAEAQAKLAEMVTDVAFNPDGSGLNALDEQITSKLADAQGKIRVAKDAVASSPWALTEAEQKAAADLALAKFKARKGTENNA